MRLAMIVPAAALAALSAAPAAMASAPVPFPVYDNGRVLVTAHPVTSGERLVINGRLIILGSVTHPGPAYIAHPLGLLPATWKGHMLAAGPAPCRIPAEISTGR